MEVTDLRALTHFRCSWRLRWGEKASAEQVELGAPVHLTLDELELGDLAFGLSVGPRRRDRGVDGGLVLGDAVGEGRDEARACSFEPWVKICVRLLADHRVESGDDLSSFHQERNALLDRRDSDGL